MMADEAVVHIGENSPEEVALKLLRMVAAMEGKQLVNTPTTKVNTDRKWILDTYAECLRTVRKPENRI
jgi:hypothetical protein